MPTLVTPHPSLAINPQGNNSHANSFQRATQHTVLPSARAATTDGLSCRQISRQGVPHCVPTVPVYYISATSVSDEASPADGVIACNDHIRIFSLSKEQGRVTAWDTVVTTNSPAVYCPHCAYVLHVRLTVSSSTHRL